MNSIDETPTFLATTALEDYWDTKQQLLYLGPWCCLFSRREHWGALGGRTLGDPWVSLDARLGALHAVNLLCEELVGGLREALNALHGRRHSHRYWMIVLEPWLHYYVAAMYDRWTRIEHAIEVYPELTSLSLSEASFVVPLNTEECVDLLKGDLYNLQLCTRIMRYLGIPLAIRDSAIRPVPRTSNTLKSLWQTRAEHAVTKLLHLIGPRDYLLLKSTYFSRRIECSFFMRTFGRVRRSAGNAAHLEAMLPCPALRSKLCARMPERNSFERLLRETLPLDIPQAFVEGYESLGAIQRSIYKPQPVAILTANAQYHDDIFKRFAASAADRGNFASRNASWNKYRSSGLAQFSRL